MDWGTERLRQLALGGVIASATLGWQAPARADMQQCLNASDKGQKARANGKLREARDQFLLCSADACPGPVRKDCSQWSSEVASSLPTVVFGARDKAANRDLFDVVVTMDGEVVMKKLDGKAVNVDPGKHTFKFEAAGFEPFTEIVLIREGEHARLFSVSFDANGTSSTADPTKEPPPPVKPEAPVAVQEHTPYPWIVVGLGLAAVAVGVVVVVTAPDRPASCDAVTKKCLKRAGETDDDVLKDQQTAGNADSQPVLGILVGGVGAALVAGGLLWHFLEPTGPVSTGKKTGFKLAPWTTGRSSGLAFGATF